MAEMSRVSRFLINLGNAGRARRLLRAVEAGFPLGVSRRALELGAGRGGLSTLLFERHHPARLVGTDFDSRQVDAARDYFARRLGSPPPGVEFRQVDALSLPFEDGSFDVVFAILMLHHVEAHHFDYRQRPTALREIRRVLAPGGYLVYSEFSRVEEMRATMVELGFRPVLERRRWPHRVLAVFQAPGVRS